MAWMLALAWLVAWSYCIDNDEPWATLFWRVSFIFILRDTLVRILLTVLVPGLLLSIGMLMILL